MTTCSLCGGDASCRCHSVTVLPMAPPIFGPAPAAVAVDLGGYTTALDRERALADRLAVLVRRAMAADDDSGRAACAFCHRYQDGPDREGVHAPDCAGAAALAAYDAVTPALEALGRRAVACRAWRWMPGMKPIRTDGYAYIHGTHIPSAKAAAELQGNPYWFPDLSDPATLGCLLALVREAWNEPKLAAVPVSDGLWMVPHMKRGFSVPIGGKYSPTEAAALVAALEAAP